MSEQILKVEIDPRDEACIQITLRHIPEPGFFSSKIKPRTVTYKGHGRDWYCLPSFKPAPSKLLPLLKEISYDPQFKHLRFNMQPKKLGLCPLKTVV